MISQRSRRRPIYSSMVQRYAWSEELKKFTTKAAEHSAKQDRGTWVEVRHAGDCLIQWIDTLDTFNAAKPDRSVSRHWHRVSGTRPSVLHRILEAPILRS